MQGQKNRKSKIYNAFTQKLLVYIKTDVPKYEVVVMMISLVTLSNDDGDAEDNAL